MYNTRRGVSQDFSEAVRLFKLSAAQGLATAQLNLGVMFARGEGVAQDYVRAYQWTNLAAINGDPHAVESRDIVAKMLTCQQIAEGQKMARECLASHYQKCD